MDRDLAAMSYDIGQPRSPLEDAKQGKPLIDRFGVTWWLVRNSHSADRVHRFVCAPTPEAAQKRAYDAVRYIDLKAMAGPLRPGDEP